MTNDQLRLRRMILAALFAAITGVLAQMTIPLPLVPITGQTLAIGLAATILGSRFGTMSIFVYLALGAVGVPVFAQMKSGISVLFGTTGGYLVGFIPTAFLIGWYMEKTSFTVKNAIIANILGMIVTLAFGTVWMKIFAGLEWTDALKFGFYPFIPVGIIKGVLAASIGVGVRKRLVSANLLLPFENNMKHSA
ncbi:biotin transporter BioY [Neobacillus sp. YIM B06451]|uniref:biotin transporter BioY n=1 Tax=Neobacillus sp. YIM B06451 TaxID=3070994 RepID=UPI002930B286|nr:biotin transporter BioY [Neobacillus sp. YIM B06451]